MKIATILFTYNRSMHTQKTLDALRNNTRKPQKLFVFQDGMKNEGVRVEWEKVNNIIHHIDWCDNEVIVSDYNKGLATAIYTGVSHVFQSYDAVIVLEDDCVSHPLFMDFMYQCLEKYEKEEQVYHVCADAIPYDVPSNGTDAYFSGRIDTLGWGTWKDRWSCMHMDYAILSRIKRNDRLNKEFETWGRDFEFFLLGNICGTCSSWATFWGLTVIEKRGICLLAYESLIEHIGYDGTGTNCGAGDIEQRLRSIDNMSEIVLPEELKIEDAVRMIFRQYSAWTSPEEKLRLYNKCFKAIIDIYRNGENISDKLKEQGITSVAIWGQGDITDILINDFKERVKVLNIVVSNPMEKKYRDIDVVNVQKLDERVEAVIVVPAYDKDIIMPQIEKTHNCKIMGIDDLLIGEVL